MHTIGVGSAGLLRLSQIAVGSRTPDSEGCGEFPHRFAGCGEPPELLLSVSGQLGWLGGRQAPYTSGLAGIRRGAPVLARVQVRRGWP